MQQYARQHVHHVHVAIMGTRGFTLFYETLISISRAHFFSPFPGAPGPATGAPPAVPCCARRLGRGRRRRPGRHAGAAPSHPRRPHGLGHGAPRGPRPLAAAGVRHRGGQWQQQQRRRRRPEFAAAAALAVRVLDRLRWRRRAAGGARRGRALYLPRHPVRNVSARAPVYA